MGRTRKILAITLVAAALCADHAVSAAPTLRPQVSSAAGRLVTRLSVSLRRVVPSVRFYETRRDGYASAAQGHESAPPLIASCSALLSPLLLHLPPPLC